MAKQTYRVEGTEDVLKAYRDFQRDVSKNSPEAAQKAAEALLPSIRGLSLNRRRTGAMAGGWSTEQMEGGAYFTNTAWYWKFQEFGTETIDPMYAIPQAWDRKQDAVLEAYNQALKQTATEAGFDQ